MWYKNQTGSAGELRTVLFAGPGAGGMFLYHKNGRWQQFELCIRLARILSSQQPITL